MKKAIIIDDEPLAIELIREYLKDYSFDVVAECNDGFQGLKAIQQYNPDIIFLDIQMPKINGFEMLELLDNPPSVIFTTAFDEYAIKAFDQNAIDYLLKPFSKERFGQSIKKYLQTGETNEANKIKELAANGSQQQDRIIVKDGTKIKIIPVQKVEYLEAADDYVRIVTSEGSFLKKQTMGFYEESLAPFHFLRIHRSYIVNTRLITRIDVPERDIHIVKLTTGKELPVSKPGYVRLKEALGI